MFFFFFLPSPNLQISKPFHSNNCKTATEIVKHACYEIQIRALILLVSYSKVHFQDVFHM